ncbi:hypothetical protein RHSIM_Rhsim03G0089100 [Rhododendron simsii]|uniref:Uncharacterized protein n=1 Tax=Rhododendron simsii TaxID=118357 RepID=A0A834H931_RHOSS|nr:hypothetical protein RHSIM_Rhsim03G0089100 [Rhododendron simsii]
MVSSSGQSSSSNNYDLSFKILLIGDSGVGKSSLLVSFISNSLEDLAPTIGSPETAQNNAVEMSSRESVKLWIVTSDTYSAVSSASVGGFRCLWDFHKEVGLDAFVGGLVHKGLQVLKMAVTVGLEGKSVDFKIKLLTVGGKRLKLTIWDTAGQEKFRTLTSSYYRGAQGIILGKPSAIYVMGVFELVYDVMRRETFTNLSDVWAKELDLHSTNQDCVKMLVGNKVDLESERVVSREEGIELAKEHGCLFLECSAKTRENVGQCFEELALKIMEVPSLLEEGSTAVKRNILKQKQDSRKQPSSSCCS